MVPARGEAARRQLQAVYALDCLGEAEPLLSLRGLLEMPLWNWRDVPGSSVKP